MKWYYDVYTLLCLCERFVCLRAARAAWGVIGGFARIGLVARDIVLSIWIVCKSVWVNIHFVQYRHELAVL